MNKEFQALFINYSGRFYIPQKLYGRDSEITSLLASFGRAAEGSKELMFIKGYSGVGKSALLAEVQKPIYTNINSIRIKKL